MAAEKQCNDFFVERASNGFIVRPNYSPMSGRVLDEPLVFQTVDQFAAWVRERFGGGQ